MARVAESDEFDPYRKWLGIPSGRRPPSHYELLGISPKEDDGEVIHIAAERQTNHVRQYQGTIHDDLAKKILYQIEEAKFVLTHGELRRQYDESLPTKAKKRRRPSKRTPLASAPSSIGATARQGYDILPTYAGIVGILLVAFMLMAGFSFWLPWKKVVFDAPDVSQPPAQVMAVSPPPNAPAAPATPTMVEAKDGRPVDRTAWVNLLAPPLLSTPIPRGEWTLAGTGVRVDPKNASYSAIRLPTPETSSYEFETEFEIRGTTEYPGVVITVPVGSSRCNVSLWTPNWLQLRHVVIHDRPSDWSTPNSNGGSTISLNGEKIGSYSLPKKQLGFGTFPDGTKIDVGLNDRCLLGVVVGEVGFQHKVVASLNGTQVLEWVGNASDFSEPSTDPDFWQGRPKEGIVIGGSSGTVIDFHTARVRPR